ncbi:MAG: hypothetical protein IPO62_00975 [Saprospiraceae bacterium]|nr:hypothetical protein [Saprospiraceae bacterium]
MKKNLFIFGCCLIYLLLYWACEKPTPPDNPFDDYNPKQDTVKFIFQDPDSNSIAGLYTYIFKLTCANSGCHDGTFDPDFRTLESSYNSLVYRETIKSDGIYSYRVKPYFADSSAIMARVNGLVTPAMPIQLEPDSDWEQKKSHYISMIRRWIEAGAPAIDGSIPIDGLPRIKLIGCMAIVKDTFLIVRKPFSGPLLIDSLVDTIDLYFAFSHDAQSPMSFTNNTISFSNHPHVYDSTAVQKNLEIGFPTKLERGLYGDLVTYTHRIRISIKELFLNDQDVFFRVYLKDDRNPLTEIPAHKAVFNLKKYMSFERIH